jgi:hypothetical protein
MMPAINAVWADMAGWALHAALLTLALTGAIAVAGLIMWRMGERAGLSLALWGGAYLLWLVVPLRLPPELSLLATFVSVFGFVWLVGSWLRKLAWHSPILVATHLAVALVALALIWVVVSGLAAP